MKYNKKDFKKFLNENVKSKNFDFEAYCEDLEQQFYETGRKQYELSKFESKNGQTILFDY